MPLATKEQLLSLSVNLPWEDVPTPELGDGVAVRIHVMSGIDRDRWDETLSKRRTPSGDVDMKGLRALLVSLCAGDESGTKLLSEEDASALAGANQVVLERLYRVAWRINLLGGAETEGSQKN